MKKYLAMILALVMALSLVACGDKKDDSADNSDGDTASGRVYWLNFKPEADEALQKVAAMYTEKTGVPVTVRRFRHLQRDPDRRDGQVCSPDAVRRGQPGRCRHLGRLLL